MPLRPGHPASSEQFCALTQSSSLILTAGSLWKGRAKIKRPQYIIRDMSEWIRVANVGELMPEGLGTAVKADGIRIAVFQWGGRVFAVEDLCPHLGFPLSEGLVQDGEVICGWHGWH